MAGLTAGGRKKLEMTAFPAHPAWDFVTRLYRAPGVGPACLDLQERHGVDVTAMLFCLWRGAVDARPLGSHMAPLMQAAGEWHQAGVLPVRAARRWLKEEGKRLGETAGTSLYKTVLAAEIDCEHGELLMLAQLADELCGPAPASGTPAAIADNFSAFLLASGVELDAQDRGSVTAILTEAGAAGQANRVLPPA